jgi:hypothetical protein
MRSEEDDLVKVLRIRREGKDFEITDDFGEDLAEYF